MKLTDKQKEELKKLCSENRKLKYITLRQILDIVITNPRMNNREIAKELEIHEVTVSHYAKLVDKFMDTMIKEKEK